jgi:hypothetical protein
MYTLLGILLCGAAGSNPFGTEFPFLDGDCETNRELVTFSNKHMGWRPTVHTYVLCHI